MNTDAAIWLCALTYSIMRATFPTWLAEAADLEPVHR